MREGTGVADTYLVYLAERPDANVYVTVSAARSSSNEAAQGGDTVWLSRVLLGAVDYDRDVVIDGETVHVPAHAIVLVFTPDAWNKASGQIVSVIAADDDLEEGDRVVMVSHSVLSGDPDFDGAAVRNVEVTVHDDDLAAIQLVQLDAAGQADADTVVIEGTSTTELTDRVRVRLATDPGCRGDGARHAQRRPRLDHRRRPSSHRASTTWRSPPARGRPAWSSPSTARTTPSGRTRTPRR